MCYYRLILVIAVLTLLAACGAAPQADIVSDPQDAPANVAAELRQVTLAMSFTPNVQFAPYYVAAANGYYADAGLDVVFDYNFEDDVVQRVAAWPNSQVEFATASGTSVLLARQQGLPVKSVMTLYQEFPVVFFSKAAAGIEAPADLQGRTLGIPGRFGESFYALLALLYANDLDESDLQVQEIGFTQGQAVLEDRVEVATGYAMNEPLVLRAQGETINVLRVADFFPLAANGIIVNEELLSQDPELVQAFVSASQRGLQATLDDPDSAFEISLQQIPEANLGEPEFQRQVLQESLPYWTSDLTEQQGLGYTDLNTWEQTHALMLDAGLLTAPLDVPAGFTNEFIN